MHNASVQSKIWNANFCAARMCVHTCTDLRGRPLDASRPIPMLPNPIDDTVTRRKYEWSVSYAHNSNLCRAQHTHSRNVELIILHHRAKVYVTGERASGM